MLSKEIYFNFSKTSNSVPCSLSVLFYQMRQFLPRPGTGMNVPRRGGSYFIQSAHCASAGNSGPPRFWSYPRTCFWPTNNTAHFIIIIISILVSYEGSLS